MFVHISPLISFIAVPEVLGSMDATTIVTRGERELRRTWRQRDSCFLRCLRNLPAAADSAFTTSLIVAVSACASTDQLGDRHPAGLWSVGARRRGRFAANVVSAMPIAVPTITLGFGYVIVFNIDTAPWLGTLPPLMVATCPICR